MSVENVAHLPARPPRWEHALVPEADYDARVLAAETWDRRSNRGWAPRLVVWWSIVEPGYMETVLPAWYRLLEIQGRRRYRMAARSRLAMDLAVMLGRRPPTDRYPLSDVTGHVYRVGVRTVNVTADDYGAARRELPPAMRYSVVQHVLEVVQ